MKARGLGYMLVCATIASCAAPQMDEQTGGRADEPRVSVSVQALTSPPDAGCFPSSFNGHDYWFCPTFANWQTARTRCQSIGYDLAVVNGASENAFLLSWTLFDAWIGGRDTQAEGVWRWVGSDQQFWQGKANGSAIGGAYTNWASFQPDDLFAQDCLAFRGGLGLGRWADESCSLQRNFICEGDLCPEDPSKTEPGVCGCGTPDTDSDEDGTPDCEDECAEDPDKSSEGICGCGVADEDSDEDGTLDCLDECPSDGRKVVVGDCGCSDAPVAAGTPCGDGLCAANEVCDGQGMCGDPDDCDKPDTQCVHGMRGGTHYWFCNQIRPFANARQRCQNADMDLTVIDSQGEDDLITAQMSSGEAIFIGASDAASEGEFSWVVTDTQFWTGGPLGEPVDDAYTNWLALQPYAGVLVDFDCVAKDPLNAGGWITAICTLSGRYVCEQAPSCADNCGGYGNGCWCDSECETFGDCCPDKVEMCGGGDPDPGEGSCEGQCGGQGGSCWCDAECEEFDDCCADKEQFCGDDPPGSESCEGQCGGYTGICWCDEGCQELGDCCEDKVLVCGDDPPPQGSCEGLCGGDAGGCWCDSGCEDLGDCCPDKVEFCGDDSEPDPPPEGTCAGQCGGPAETCWCDATCHVNGDCCPDKIALCGDESEPPPDIEGTCEGQCGGSTDTCWCDDGCEDFGDCCPDKVDLCGPSP